MDKKYLKDIIQWDIQTWSQCIKFWDNVINEKISDKDEKLFLDIGARDGGLTLFFGQKGFQCICSDLDGPTDNAHNLHRDYKINGKVTYEKIDCTKIPYPDNHFDCAAFKSILGGVGYCGRGDKIDTAMNEIHRVLKPNGILFFAENLSGSYMHTMLRRLFVPWGKDWNYMSFEAMKNQLERYSHTEIHTYGFWGCLKKDNPILGSIDRIWCRKEPSTNQYMCYGYAVK